MSTITSDKCAAEIKDYAECLRFEEFHCQEERTDLERCLRGNHLIDQKQRFTERKDG